MSKPAFKGEHLSKLIFSKRPSEEGEYDTEWMDLPGF